MATLSGTVRDAYGALAARIVRAYRKDSGALVAEATSNAVTGEFSLTVPPHYLYTVVAEDAVYDPYCTLLMHMDGANNGTAFVEETGRAISVAGAAKTVTGVSAFGGSSAYFDGAGSHLSVAASADMLVGSGDFTLEAMVRPVTLPAAGYSAICGKYNSAGNLRSYSLEIYYTGSVQQIYLLMSTTGTGAEYALFGTFACPTTAFTHLMACRKGDTAYLFANGALLNTLNVGSAALFANTETPFTVGARTGGVASVNTYVDEVRLSVGSARATADFSATPVAAPYSRLLSYGSNAVILDDVVPV